MGPFINPFTVFDISKIQFEHLYNIVNLVQRFLYQSVYLKIQSKTLAC